MNSLWRTQPSVISSFMVPYYGLTPTSAPEVATWFCPVQSILLSPCFTDWLRIEHVTEGSQWELPSYFCWSSWKDVLPMMLSSHHWLVEWLKTIYLTSLSFHLFTGKMGEIQEERNWIFPVTVHLADKFLVGLGLAVPHANPFGLSLKGCLQFIISTNKEAQKYK